MAITTEDLTAKMFALEPGLLDLPESLALAEKSVLEILADMSAPTVGRLKAAELIFQKHQIGAPDAVKAAATKEDFEHLRGIISEVKEVLEGHVSFYERKYARGTAPSLEGTS